MFSVNFLELIEFMKIAQLNSLYFDTLNSKCYKNEFNEGGINKRSFLFFQIIPVLLRGILQPILVSRFHEPR